jgi:hypothetical protein
MFLDNEWNNGTYNLAQLLQTITRYQQDCGVSMIEALLTHGARVTEDTVLYAANHGSLGVMSALLNHILHRELKSSRALLEAAQAGRNDIVRLLVDVREPDVNWRVMNGG